MTVEESFPMKRELKGENAGTVRPSYAVEESFPMKRELKGAKPNRDTAQPGEMKVFIRGRKEEGYA